MSRCAGFDAYQSLIRQSRSAMIGFVVEVADIREFDDSGELSLISQLVN